MSRIFLSHATEEHELVIHLANHLEKNNLKAWYAPRDIMGGIDYDKEIIAAIKDCRAFVLLLSRNSDASEDVKTEVYHAVKYHKQVICLDVDDVEPENLSYLLGMRHRLNWLERRDETLDKLVHDIKRIPEPASDGVAQPDVEVKPRIEANPAVKVEPKLEAEPVIETKPKAEIKPPVETKPKVEAKPTVNVSKPEPKTDGFVKILIAGLMIAFVAVLVILLMHAGKYASWNSTWDYDIIFNLARNGTPEKIRNAARAGANFAITSDTLGSEDNVTTTLFVAVSNNTAEAVSAIIETGVDVNAVGNSETSLTALMQASALGKLDMLKILIDAGADVNAKDNNGATALIQTAWKGNFEVAEFLLKHGADVNAMNNDGCTALMFAAFDGHPKVAEVLLAYGANKNLRDKNGSTAYDYVRYVRKGSDVRKVKGFSASLLQRMKPDR